MFKIAAYISAMTYPRSDHYDGSHFFNPETGPGFGRRGGFVRVLRRRFSRDPAAWAKWPARVDNQPHPPLGERDGVRFLGHAMFLIRLGDVWAITDPIFSARCSPSQTVGPQRVRAPGLGVAELPEIGLVLLSHNHYDHMDLGSLRALKGRFPGARIITPLGNGAYLARKGIGGSIELDWWESVRLGAVEVTITPARHFSARTLRDRRKMLWGGLVMKAEGKSVYFAGDTAYTGAFAEIGGRLGAPDLALLPIGAYEPRDFMRAVHMNPDDAVRACLDLGAKRAIGMHFGTFQLTAEEIDAPVRALAAARAAHGVAEERFFTLDVGESWGFQGAGDLSG
ncbi:MBL fold metallo-hydrolase [Acidocella sp.]|uniref:MBL fold metallo-hydrolase n=1 Tax=Acidocella sp. TaxID=50710 RepID=UPI00262CA71D|nr:MBL fold metallo-hydrolase [Acidocella sp.]